METLILHVSARSARSAELTRSHGRSLTVGRGFDNDVVLSDPYVAPYQLRFDRDAEGWQVVRLDHTNPVLINGHAMEADRARVVPGDRVTTGRTELGVHAPDEALEPARKLLLSSWAFAGRVGPFVTFGFLLLVCTLDSVADFLQFSTDLEWEQHAYAALFSAVILVVWSGVWAVVGRILRHHPHFFDQLAASTLVFLGVAIAVPAVSYLEFVTGSVAQTRILSYLVAFAGLFALLRFNLSFATSIRHTTRAAGIVSAAIVVLVFASLRFASDDSTLEPSYSRVVKPPFAHLTGDASIEAFAEAARRLEPD